MFNRFVEAGRLALITYGPMTGKLCVIVDIIDGTKVVVDGPKDITGKFFLAPVFKYIYFRHRKTTDAGPLVVID